MLTAEFGSELEAERQVRLRRRFLWYTGTVATINSLGVLREALFSNRAASDFSLSSLLLQLTSVVLYVVAWSHVRRRRVTRWPLLTITTWLIVASGTVTLLSGPVTIFQQNINSSKQIAPEGQGLPGLIQVTTQDSPELEEAKAQAAAAAAANSQAASTIEPDETERPTPRPRQSSYLGGWGVWNILITHVLACAFLPWTARESMRPILPLLIMNAAVTLLMLTYLRAIDRVSPENWIWAGVFILFSPLVASPGAALCWWRHSRFRDEVTTRIVRGRYAEMRRELTDARRIHESLFPRMKTDGVITFSYFYEPMRQIGGDYLYVQSLPDDGLHVVIMDVTGHGIPAALTVNRLHGELQRIFAEQPRVSPGEVLRLLNRYVNLTMADHALFVTAICLRVEPSRGVVDYASGGHPPAYLRSADGAVHELPATTYLLGAEMDAEFKPGEATVNFRPGDRIAAFTDGAVESRGENGRMLGLAGMRALVARTDVRGERDWAGRLLQAVDQFRFGPPTDDTLVVEIGFSLPASTPPATVKPPAQVASRV